MNQCRCISDCGPHDEDGVKDKNCDCILMHCMKPISSTKLLADILCAIIIYGLSSPLHDFDVIQLFGASKANRSQRKLQRRQEDIKMT